MMIPVLMYHGLHASPRDRGHFDPVYSVTPEAFAQQLDWLAQHGYRTLRLSALDAPLPPRCVVLTFDDGDITDRDVALPALSRRRMVAEFCITTDFLGRRGSLVPQDVHMLAQAGMGIQSHGRTHRYLDDLDEADLEFELAESRRVLRAISGQAVTGLALPGGRGGARERAAALRAGFRHLLSSVPGSNAEWCRGEYLQRLAVTRGVSIEDFAGLVQWRGLAAPLRAARYAALAQAKRLLGNERYERWRERVVPR